MSIESIDFLNGYTDNDSVVCMGDTHGVVAHLLATVSFAAEQGIRYVLQVGDFGFLWERDDIYTLSALSLFARDLGVTILWADGNHEGFEAMAQLGVDIHGDSPQQIKENVIYLPRGCRFRLGGRDCMSFGGGVSIDAAYRTLGKDYFLQETVKDYEVERAGWEHVDVLFCHDTPIMGPRLDMYCIGNDYKVDWRSDDNRRQLYQVADRVTPSLIVHGHYHYPYTDVVDEPWGKVMLIGLGCNADSAAKRILEPVGSTS